MNNFDLQGTPRALSRKFYRKFNLLDFIDCLKAEASDKIYLGKVLSMFDKISKRCNTLDMDLYSILEIQPERSPDYASNALWNKEGQHLL